MKVFVTALVLAAFVLVACNPAQQSSTPPADKATPASAQANSPEALCTPPDIIHTALIQFGGIMTEKGPQSLRTKIRQTPLTGRSLVVDFEDGPPMYYRQYVLSYSIPELRSHDKETGQIMCHARFALTGLTLPSAGVSSIRTTYAGMYRIFKSEGKTFVELSLDPSSKSAETISDRYQQAGKPTDPKGTDENKVAEGKAPEAQR